MAVFRYGLVIFLALSFAPIKPAQAASFTKKALRCLALNLYWEAKSEGRKGMIAVGWVVLNRLDDGDYPDKVCAVIQQGGENPPCEWSWWCDGRADRPKETDAWEMARKVARRLLSDPPPDPTHGALWYHRDSLKRPSWLKRRKKTAHIGGHVFYR